MSLARGSLFGICLGGLAIGLAAGYWRIGVPTKPLAEKKNGGEKPPWKAPSKSTPEAAADSPYLQRLDHLMKCSREELVALSVECVSGTSNFIQADGIWDRWIELDPAGGFEALVAGEFGSKERVRNARTYLARWSMVDPDAAINRLLALPEEYTRSVASSMISGLLSAERPRDFFRLYKELKKQGPATNCIRSAAANLAEVDSGAVLKLPAEGPPGAGAFEGSDLHNIYAGYAIGAAKRNVMEVIGWARQLEGNAFRRTGLEAIAEQVAAHDPTFAAELIKEAWSNPENADPNQESWVRSNEVLQTVTAEMAVTNPGAALAWLQQNFPEKGEFLIRRIANQQIPWDANAAVELILSQPDLYFKDGRVTSWPSDWNPGNAEEGLARVEQIADPKLREPLQAILINAMAQTDPAEAIRAAQTQLTDTAARKNILRNAMKVWAGEDITAASTWLSTQTTGVERDAAIVGLIEVAARVEPDSALDWAVMLTAPEERTQNLVSMLRQMGCRDAGAAAEILRRLPLPAAEQESIAQKLNPVQPSQ